ncbi:hypothetical protein BV22DRAFT_792667 [Leucogyrophana mollusca]|uniref:Uncharacterized protein n=1 Tax=Leucogyrophana mollusca TaxID=85980 RepID=A0ACB8B500_9AGAM|nr:hypothetical protein BV22DRAFT_792667 [Leucogyrophana mollusca]
MHGNMLSGYLLWSRVPRDRFSSCPCRPRLFPHKAQTSLRQPPAPPRKPPHVSSPARPVAAQHIAPQQRSSSVVLTRRPKSRPTTLQAPASASHLEPEPWACGILPRQPATGN